MADANLKFLQPSGSVEEPTAILLRKSALKGFGGQRSDDRLAQVATRARPFTERPQSNDSRSYKGGQRRDTRPNIARPLPTLRPLMSARLVWRGVHGGDTIEMSQQRHCPPYKNVRA